MRLSVLEALNGVRERGLRKLLPDRPRIGVGLGTCGVGNGAREVFQAIVDALENRGVDAQVTTLGCFGFCAGEPLVTVHLPGQPMVVLSKVQPGDADEIADELAVAKAPLRKALCRIDHWDHLTGAIEYGSGLGNVPLWNEVPFYAGQKKIVLRNCGLINPEDIEEYVGVGGYFALHKALTQMAPEQIIEEMKTSKLRGRGGAGFPAGAKWSFLAKAPGDEKYIICNADEGDPGAYMNRNEMESDPHALVEGMIIGGYAMGANTGIIYIRAEYPLAVMRLRRAIEQARDMGLLGKSILGTGFDFDLKIVEGAGAFVCGEETALIASLEGKAGRPRPRPPFPAQKGYKGKPTNINNVETWYNVAPIILKGGDWFTQTGTANSTGTKVFSLVGKIKNTGLVEMPLGSPLKHIIYSIGEGTGDVKKVKAVQTGGPSGGCIPAEHFDAAVDYESLAELGAIMGSGGMVVMDEDNCMVDVARYFVEFTRSESCGKCIPCRVGLDQAHRILTDIAEGRAALEDLDRLEELAVMIRDTSLCGLGQTGPNPVLTTLKYFQEEYLDHVLAKRCPATACEELFVSPCENSCPLHMNIPGYMTLLKEGRMDDAFESVFLDNPLPASTGRVCQHPCELRCRRMEIDEAVSIRNVHRYLADQLFSNGAEKKLFKRLKKRQLPETGFKVAIAGAGPAGLSAGFYLRMMGHAVTIYDALPKPGGLLRYGLPEYREPKSMLDREIGLIEKLGVQFECGKTIGVDVPTEKLEEEFDAVFLAIGTWQENALGIPGADLPNVFNAVEFLKAVGEGKRPGIGQKVVVIGGGNSAIDSARTAIRLGADVTVVYRRERVDMPAIPEETEAAEAEGVKLEFMAIPKQVHGQDGVGPKSLEVIRAEMGEYDAWGRRVPKPTGDAFSIECDSIIVAIGEKVDGNLIRRIGVKTGKQDRVQVNPYSLQTDRAKVYAGGDLVSGPANVSTAMGYGKQFAGVIDKALTGENHLHLMRGVRDYGQEVPASPEGGPRNDEHELPPRERAETWDEALLGLDEHAALCEAQRCLRCDVKVVTEMQPAQVTVST